MASTIKVDQIEGSSGSTITIPTGQTFTITDGVGVASGGTGLSSFTAGDLLYATGATTLVKLAKGTAEQILSMNSGATAPECCSNSWGYRSNNLDTRRSSLCKWCQYFNKISKRIRIRYA